MQTSAMEVARAVMLSNLGEPTELPLFSHLDPAAIAMAMCGITAACFKSGGDPQQALVDARMMVDAPEAVAVTAAMIDGGEDVLSQAAEICSEKNDDQDLLLQAFQLGKLVQLFSDVDQMREALKRLD
jgi:hypothetical protein